MTIQFTFRQNAGITTGDLLTTVNSQDPAANELWVVFVPMRTITIAPSIAGTGLTWNLAGSVINAQNQIRGFLWWGISQSDPSAGFITVTMTGNLKPAQMMVYKVTGVDPTTPIQQVLIEDGPTALEGDNQAMLDDVTTSSKNNVVVGHGSHRGNAFDLPVGETLISSNFSGTAGDRVTATGWYEVVPNPALITIGVDPDLTNPSDWILITLVLQPPIEVVSSEAVAVSESINSVATTGPVVISEAVSVAETVGITKVYNVSVSEAVGVAETVSAILVMLVETEESISVDEAVEAYPPVLFVNVSDTIDVAESHGVTLGLPVAKSESITVIESVALVVFTALQAQEEIEVFEQISVAITLRIAVQEAVSVAESVGFAFAHFGQALDSVTVTEVVAVVMVLQVDVSESIGVSETFGFYIPTHFIDVTEFIVVSEVVRRISRRYGARICDRRI